MVGRTFALVFLLLLPFVSAQETPDPQSCPEGKQLTEIETGVFACKPISGYVPPEPPPGEGRRFLYNGYVDIEQATFDELKSRLEAQDCGTQGTIEGCFYEERFIITESSPVGRAVPVGEEQKEEQAGINVLVVHPTGASFGPTDFAITETRLYASRDIEGPRDDEKFKAAVENEVAKLGNFVILKRETWTIVRVIDSSGLAYATGGGSNLLSLVESVESQGTSRGRDILVIIAAVAVFVLFVVTAYRKLK